MPQSNQSLLPLPTLIVFLACFVLLTPRASAASPVWKISKNGQHLFIGGTVHLLAQSDHPLPKSFDTAYNQANKIVFETDINAMKSPAFLLKMNGIITFNNGQTLRNTLQAQTYHKLEAYFKARGMDILSFSGLTPTGVMLTISTMELQLLGMNPSLGVEMTYIASAQRDKKPLDHLESIDEHLSFIANMGGDDNDALLLQTLAELNALPATLAQLKKAWRAGNNAMLEQLTLSEMKKHPHIYESLLVVRNNNWLPKIEAMLNDNPIELILVGALHLVGEDGLLRLLQQKGYIIENI
ncbi:MAG: TraB/GumN family protein [Agarilytica sp.]